MSIVTAALRTTLLATSVVGLGLGGAVLASPAAAAPARPSAASYSSAIENWGSGLCLGITGSSQAGGARAVQGGCSGDTSQEWTWRAETSIAGLNYIQLENGHSGLCLGVQGTSTASGAQLVQGTCSNTSDHSQFWEFDGGTSPQDIVNGHSGLCMGIQGSSSASGANVLQGTCAGSPTQHWIFN